jgi:multiple sugar transport system permease protein
MRWIRNVPIYAVLLAGALLTLAPFALSVITAFKTPGQFASENALAWPDPFTLENFTMLLTGRAEFGRAILVTLLAAILLVAAQLTFSIMAAYAFARLEFPGRDLLFWVYLSTLMIPSIVVVVPLYLMMAQLGLRNTFWGLVLPFAFASPYAVFLLREYFRGIPQDLVDAARLDGANTLDVLVEIVVPLSRPIIATLTLITAVSQWNSFLWPRVITSDNTWRPVTVATASLQSQYNGNWTLVMAATTLALVPLLALFLVFQRQIVRSIAITRFR